MCSWLWDLLGPYLFFMSSYQVGILQLTSFVRIVGLLYQEIHLLSMVFVIFRSTFGKNVLKIFGN